MPNNLKVYKFGGASVKDAASIRNVGNILQKEKGNPLVIVVSAMGKNTNALEGVLKEHFNQTGKATEVLEKIKQFHYQVCTELFGEKHPVYDDLNDTFVEIEWVLDDEPEGYDYMYDQIVSVGELLSTKILTAYLNSQDQPTQWLDARGIIRTDELYRDAWVQWEETEANAKIQVTPILEAGKFVLTQGFIGSTADNNTTTLGREGSDYTAAIFSFCLNAESMSIWKDVEGVMTADPRLFDQVTKIDKLSYREAIEMTYYGAKVIHPKTIKPLQNKNIPLFVKSYANPSADGTMITSDVNSSYPPMIAVEKNQVMLNISTKDFSFVAEHHMKNIFEKIAEKRLQVNMMQNTAISFDICVNDIDDRVENFAEAMKEDFEVTIEKGLELITIRHFQKPLVESLKHGKIIMMEHRIRETVQLVMKEIPMMVRK